MTSSGHQPEPSGRRVDLGRLRRADLAVAGGTLLYLVFMSFPWFRIDAFDLGSGFRIPAVSVNGFDSGALTVASVLLLLASAWALVPAFADVAVPLRRSTITAGLVAPAFVLTLIEWLSTFDAGFTVMGLLTFLSSLAVLAFVALRLLPELRGRDTVPGRRLGRAVQWANRAASRSGARGGVAQPVAGQPAGPPPASPQPSGQPPPDRSRYEEPAPDQPPYGPSPYQGPPTSGERPGRA